MSDETLLDFLNRRERELTNKIAAAEGSVRQTQAAIREMQAELGQVLNAKQSFDEVGGKARLASERIDRMLTENGPKGPDSTHQSSERLPVPNPFFGPQGLTIKELIRQVLVNRSPLGATTAQIADFIRDAYGRDVQPDSLRAQLARSKAQGMIETDGGEWRLTPGGRMYDHPSSWDDADK